MSTTNIEPHRKHINNRSFSPCLDWFYKGSRPFYVATFTSATVSTKSTQRNFDSLIAKISKHWTLVGVFDIWELGPIIFIDPSALDGWHGQYLIGHLHLSRAFPWYHLRLVRPGNSRFFIMNFIYSNMQVAFGKRRRIDIWIHELKRINSAC